jgi:ubiquinone/menaquinone biosynthesis C-methylase UbiE
MAVLRLGITEVSPAASAALVANHADSATFFRRHQQGDWGNVEERRRNFNDLAAQQDEIVLSAYTLEDGTEIIVTTAADRSSTYLLLAAEYQRAVSTQEGYAIWSATYDSEKNSLIAVEEAHVNALLGTLAITTALDVGAGTGRYALQLAKRGVAVSAIDFSPEMMQVARQAAQEEGLTIDFRHGSISDDLPFASHRFDFVICALMLCHVSDLAHAFQEFYRVLQPGGYLLISAFHPDAIAFGWNTSFRERRAAYVLPNMPHTRADYVDTLGRTGFTLLKVIDALVGEIPDDYPSKAMLRDYLEKNFCLIILAQKQV